MKQFALIGAAGYIAPRHMQAISQTGNKLVAALDKCDSVGIIDSYFPDADFFTEFERFDRHIEKLKRRNADRIDYVSICSPNYLHDAHIRFALRVGAHAICEKPLVLNPWNVDALETIESETGGRVYNILQLRLHPAIKDLKAHVNACRTDEKFDIDLTYISPRGKWYLYSWKGQPNQSGGIATNIGIHFFDMLIWIFGPVVQNTVHVSGPRRAAGFLELEKARVRWFLSIDHDDLRGKAKGYTTYRSVTVNGQQIDFSNGFTDLHVQSYQQILTGNGFGLSTARPAIDLVYDIRNADPVGIKGDFHPRVKPSGTHPCPT